MANVKLKKLLYRKVMLSKLLKTNKIISKIVGVFFITSTYSQGPPIFTETPIMFGVEGRGVRTFGNIVQKENANAYIQPIAIPYNITNKWQVGAIVPFVAITPNGMSTNFSIGDLNLFVKRQLYQIDGKAKTLRGLLKITETLPTGKTSGIPPLGADAWQTNLSTANAYVTTKFGIYSEIGYTIKANELADNFIYNLAFGLPLLPQKYPPKQLNIYLELNGVYEFDDIGNNLFISPGLQFIAGRKFLLETGIQLPLEQAAPEGQKTDYILRIGTRILIF